MLDRRIFLVRPLPDFFGVTAPTFLAIAANTIVKNSLDLVRLVAAILVLYSHQHALLGLPEPTPFGWASFGSLGTAGVTVFFFLSGMLIWQSWDRDPDLRRFFLRRLLRIFPALWLVVILSVFVLGPLLTTYSLSDYFSMGETWRYLGTAILVNAKSLPGLFADSPFPSAVNGSLWTLPVEFFCYVSVAMLGLAIMVLRLPRQLLIASALLFSTLAAAFGPAVLGSRYTPHLEMVAIFWWGVSYGYWIRSIPEKRLSEDRIALAAMVAATLVFVLAGLRGFEHMAMLVCTTATVHLALATSIGARLTDRCGDLSYGVYIFAFPIQQMIVELGAGRTWGFGTHFSLSLAATSFLAFISWHLVEKRVLLFKPKSDIEASPILDRSAPGESTRAATIVTSGPN